MQRDEPRGRALYEAFWARNPNPTTAPAWDDQADAIKSMWTGIAADADALAVPAGWKLVPVEPTEAMIEAYFQRMHAVGFRRGINASEAWAALNSASPAPPSPWMEIDENTPRAGAWRDIPTTKPVVEYVQHYGSRCRECADNDGVCPMSGLPCGASETGIKFVISALNYGFSHGFIKLPSPPSEIREGGA